MTLTAVVISNEVILYVLLTLLFIFTIVAIVWIAFLLNEYKKWVLYNGLHRYES